MFPNSMLPKAMVKSLVHRLLFSVNWLHATCGTIHTDITPQNVLTTFQSPPSLEDDASKELDDFGAIEDPSASSSVSDKYQISGIPVLTDFGQMRLMDSTNTDWCMPDLYRAPEMLLGLPWSFPVDVWSIGVMTLELLEGKNVFDPIDHTTNEYVRPWALAQYIALMGNPPSHMLRESPVTSLYFSPDGSWNGGVPVPRTSLDEFVTAIAPGKEKEKFLTFVRKMLTWDPEVRETTNELIEDEWLMTPDVEF